MTQGSVQQPKSPLSRRLLVLCATTFGALGLSLGGCILRDGVAGGMFPGGGFTDSDLGDASGHGHRQRPGPAPASADPKGAGR